MTGRHRQCDAQARAGLIIVWAMALLGASALVGLIALAWMGKATETVTITALVGIAQSSMTGLPSLLARMSSQTEAHITNPPSEPVPVAEKEP